jgi:hypothetical protein
MMPITKIRIDQWITSDGTPFLAHAEAEAHERRWLLREAFILAETELSNGEAERLLDVLTSPQAPFIILTKREGAK